MSASKQLLQAIAVTCELTGTQVSDGAARVLAADLSAYPEQQVLGALDRCRKELRSRLTLADIISRLDDGRPGPEEAWAIAAKTIRDESITVVWTDEIAHAWGIARGLGDNTVAARMAFVETYRRLVQVGRDAGLPVKWVPCLGFDANGREAALTEAVRLGRLTGSHVVGLLPHLSGQLGGVLAVLEQKGNYILDSLDTLRYI